MHKSRSTWKTYHSCPRPLITQRNAANAMPSTAACCIGRCLPFRKSSDRSLTIFSDCRFLPNPCRRPYRRALWREDRSSFSEGCGILQEMGNAAQRGRAGDWAFPISTVDDDCKGAGEDRSVSTKSWKSSRTEYNAVVSVIWSSHRTATI